jgi:hypothetical protein
MRMKRDPFTSTAAAGHHALPVASSAAPGRRAAKWRAAAIGLHRVRRQFASAQSASMPRSRA